MIGKVGDTHQALRSMLCLASFWQQAFVATWSLFKETWTGMPLPWIYPGGISNQEAAVFAKVQMEVSKLGRFSTTLITFSIWSGRQQSGTPGK